MEALIAIAKPANSLAARIETLTDEQRDYYEKWKAHWDRWISKCRQNCDDDDERDARPYQLSLDGFGPVELRDDISTALYGPKAVISITVGDMDAVNIYNEFRGQ